MKFVKTSVKLQQSNSILAKDRNSMKLEGSLSKNLVESSATKEKSNSLAISTKSVKERSVETLVGRSITNYLKSC